MRRGLGDARIASLVLLAAAVGFAGIVRPTEGAIATESITLDRLRRERDTDDRMLTVRTKLVGVRASTLDALEGITTNPSLVDLESAFLRESERIANRHRIVLQSIDAGARQVEGNSAPTRPAPGATAAARTAQPTLVDGVTFDVRLTGRYTEVLAFIADLSRASILVEVASTSLSRKNDGEGELERFAPDAPKVGATIRAVAYRIDREHLARIRNGEMPRALP